MNSTSLSRSLAGSLLCLVATAGQAAVTPVTDGQTSIKLTSIEVMTNELGLNLGFIGDTSITGVEDGFPVVSLPITGGFTDDETGDALLEHTGSGFVLSDGSGNALSASNFVLDTIAGTLTPSSMGQPTLPMFTVSANNELLISSELSSALSLLFGTGDLSGAVFGELVTEPPAQVPVPAAAWMFGSALAGLVVARRRHISG